MEGNADPGASGSAPHPLDVQISKLQHDLTLISDGSHPEFIRQCKLLEKIREEKLNAAAEHKAFIMRVQQGLYDLERKQAEEDFENDKQTLKQRLTCIANDKIKRLEDEKMHHQAMIDELNDTRSAMQRKLRKRERDKMAGDVFGGFPTPAAAPAKGRKRETQTFAISYTLTLQEINDDYAVIQRIIDDSGKHGHSSARESASSSGHHDRGAMEKPVKSGAVYIERGQLITADGAYDKGQTVVVEARSGGSKNVGTIVSLNAQEILLRRPNGAKFRVYVQDLKKGKFIVTPPNE